MSSAAAPRPLRQPHDGERLWRERSSRLFAELRRPASAMVRRAFGSAFADHEIEDIYSNAWLGTLRALQGRHPDLDDEEIRKYLFTAVAHQASKELRRRRRKPIAPLERAQTVADSASPPEEQADQAEQSRITRDLLSSLPRRRRAVLLLRYGWGLEPSQVCELIEGLSPRAYRKEITRGIDQLTERLRVLESGEWCADREPILKAFAAGTADSEQQQQAQHHLAHCRHCADFVGRLSGHLHDLGSSVMLPSAIDLAADGRLSIPDRLADAGDRARESIVGAFSRGSTESSEALAAAIPSAAPRGAGATGVGVVAKLAGLGAAGKATVACIGGGAAAVCVAAGFGPVGISDPGGQTGHVGRQGEVRSLGSPSMVDVLPKEPRSGVPQPDGGDPGQAVADEVPPHEPSPEEMHGGNGNDFIVGGPRAKKVVGGDDGEVQGAGMYGHQGPDLLDGGGGGDGMQGEEGNDTYHGGPGADQIDAADDESPAATTRSDAGRGTTTSKTART